MSLIESLIVAIFCMVLVFVILTCLFAMVRLLSYILNIADNKKAKIPNMESEVKPITNITGEKKADSISTGELKLYNVDEKIAAMIMAIVSYESKIPLSELSFKVIKAIE